MNTKRPIVLNQSLYKTFNNCQRLYGWYKIAGLEPVGKRSVLEIGTAVHAGLALFHGGGFDAARARAESTYPEEMISELEQLPTAADQAIALATYTIEESAGPTKSFMDKELGEARDVVQRVLPAYIAHYAGTDEIWKPLNQEIQFLVEVGSGHNVFLRGRADNLSIAKGGLYLVDYKTAGRMDPRDLLKYEIDTQLSAYIYGLSKFLSEQSAKEGGPPVYIRGAIIDVLVKTQVPQFARELYTRTEEELADFEDEWIEICSRIREQEDRVTRGEDWKTVFPKNTEHCFRYGTCPFRDLCLKDTPVRRAAFNKRERTYVDEAQTELDEKFLKGEI